jgi:hypothetical protein
MDRVNNAAADLPTAPQRIQQFQSSQEAQAAHPRLDSEAPMPKESFRAITGVYMFPRTDWVLCQLTVAGGTVCRQEHGKGWIMQRADGVEGFIGHDCARDHFGADQLFRTEAARARREVRTDELVARLKTLLSDPTRRERLQDGFKRQQQLRRDVRRTRDLLPNSVKTRLHDMTRTSNRSVQVQFEYRQLIEDKDGKEREVSKWERRVIGAVINPSAIDLTAVELLGERFRSASAALEYADPSPERTEKELRTWVRNLEDVEQCEADVDEAAESLDAFAQPENLRLLCWTCRNPDEQIQVARAALTLARGTEVSDSAARKPLEDWRRTLSDANQGRRFRAE